MWYKYAIGVSTNSAPLFLILFLDKINRCDLETTLTAYFGEYVSDLNIYLIKTLTSGILINGKKHSTAYKPYKLCVSSVPKRKLDEMRV